MKRFLIALLLVGCQRPAAKPIVADLLLELRIVVVTDAAGNSPWIAEMYPEITLFDFDTKRSADLAAMQRVFRSAGIVTHTTIVQESRPAWFNAGPSQRAEMFAIRSSPRTLWLVNSISFTEGTTARGFAALDAFLAWDANRCGVNFPHELLHTFGLNHVEVAENVMRGKACGGEQLTAAQVQQLRNAVSGGACTATKCEGVR